MNESIGRWLRRFDVEKEEQYSTEQILSAWTVTWVLRFRQDIVHITKREKVRVFAPSMQLQHRPTRQPSYVLYRTVMLGMLMCGKTMEYAARLFFFEDVLKQQGRFDRKLALLSSQFKRMNEMELMTKT